MTDSPFGTPGAPGAQQPVPAASGSSPSTKIVPFAIGAVLVLGGFVWKFLAGTAATGDQASFLDFAWLLPVLAGAVVIAVGLRRKKD